MANRFSYLGSDAVFSIKRGGSSADYLTRGRTATRNAQSIISVASERPHSRIEINSPGQSARCVRGSKTAALSAIVSRRPSGLCFRWGLFQTLDESARLNGGTSLITRWIASRVRRENRAPRYAFSGRSFALSLMPVRVLHVKMDEFRDARGLRKRNYRSSSKTHENPRRRLCRVLKS